MTSSETLVNVSVKINSYVLLENPLENTIQLFGTLDSCKWNGAITIMHVHEFTLEEQLNMLRTSGEECSYHLIKEKFYKIFVTFEEMNTHTNLNGLPWNNLTSHRDINIPDIIFCYLVGQISAIL